MANRLRYSSDQAGVARRHGKTGHVQLNVQVPRDVKDRLVSRAEMQNVPLVTLVRDAIELYLEDAA